jgi:hypothetical protein
MTESTKAPAARPEGEVPQAAVPPAGSREALRIGAAVLEVLAGLRSAAEAATALGCSVGRYYQLEQQALRALVAGCEPRPMGRQPSADAELVRLRQENTRLLRECQRQQALVRLARQAAGLAAPPASSKPAAGKRRSRNKSARGAAAATRLRQASEAATPAEASEGGPVAEASG